MEAIWERHRPTMLARVAVLERATVRASAGALKPALAEEACTAAHQLAGSVGTFGYARASELARELEKRLRAGDAAGAEPLVSDLREALLQAPVVADVRTASPMPPPPPPPARAPEVPRGLPLILFVTTDSDEAQRLRAEAARRGLRADAVATTDEAHGAIRRDPPAALVVYGQAALDALNGVDMPVLLVARDDGLPARLAGAQAGAVGFLGPDATAAAVIDDVGLVLELASPAAPRVLAVGDVGDLDGVELVRVADPQDLPAELERFAPALVILATPDARGLCAVLRADRRWSALALVVIGKGEVPGADDVVTAAQLPGRVRMRLDRARTHVALAETDPLTGAGNRRASGAALGRLLRLAERNELAVCVVVIELDGPETARRLGTLLRRGLRGEDVLGHFNDRTFVLGMAGVGREAAVDRIDGVRMRSGLPFSAGVAQYPVDGRDLESLYDGAERALRTTRHAGAEQVVGAGRGSGTTQSVDVAIVEAEDAAAALVHVSLTERGHRCWRFSNGASAIDMLGGDEPRVRAGVILLDLNLPAVGGLELLTVLAQNGVLRSSRVIVVSANDDPEMMERTRALGAEAYLVKPIDLPLLAERVDEALGRRR